MNQCCSNNIWIDLCHKPRCVWCWLNRIHMFEHTVWFSAATFIFPVTLNLISVEQFIAKMIDFTRELLKIRLIRMTFKHSEIKISTIFRMNWVFYRAFSMTICRSGQFGWKHWFSTHFGHTRSWPNALGSCRYWQLVPYFS